MPSESFDEKRFEYLSSKLLDNALEGAELREFVVGLRANPELTERLCDDLQTDSLLAQHENLERSAEAFTVALEGAVDAERDGDDFVARVLQSTDEPVAQTRSVTKTPWVIAVLAMAACAVLVFLVSQKGEGEQGPIDEPVVAEAAEPIDEGVAVIASVSGEIMTENGPLRVGDSMPAGKLKITQGAVSLEFYQGARLMVSGPADLELIDAQRVICSAGKARAIVPQVAVGFTIVTPSAEIVDLGTEFCVEVERNVRTDVHVFDGKVALRGAAPKGKNEKILRAGRAMRLPVEGDWFDIPIANERFQDFMQLEAIEQVANDQRFERWKSSRASFANDPRLIANYACEPDVRSHRTLLNQSHLGEALDGAIVGGQWTEGPWPGKSALSFKRPSDRVRVNLPGDHAAITLASWVRFEGIDRRQSSLLLADGFDDGELHWQLRAEGHFVLGHRQTEKARQNYVSPLVVDFHRLGRWMHVATVIDPKEKKVRYYFDGELAVTRRLSTRGPFRFGRATIGNWNSPLENAPSEIRNLNGRIAELLVFGAALSTEEIRELALVD